MISLTPGAIAALKLCADSEVYSPASWDECDFTPAEFESLKAQKLIHQSSSNNIWWPTWKGYLALRVVA